MTSYDPNLAGVLFGIDYKWGSVTELGQPETLTYSFMETLPDYYAPSDVTLFAPMTEAGRQAAREALSDWEAVSGLRFIEVEDNVGGDIRFGMDSALPDSEQYAGYAYRPIAPDSEFYEPNQRYGDVFTSQLYDYNLTPEVGNYGYYVLLHEIGHALGLKHPFEEPALATAFDDIRNTVMSYTFLAGLDEPRPTDPAWLDIHAAQFLYGVPGSGSAGVTAWGSDATELYTAPDGISRYLANGGDDWVLMGEAEDIVLGGDGDDTLSGAEASDRLYGGAGDDFLDGGTGDDGLNGAGGDDLLIGGGGLDVASYDASILVDRSGGVWRDGGVLEFEGRDTLDGVELLRMADHEVVLTLDRVTDSANFDEGRYLALNPDVAAAVAAGTLPSGHVHYLAFGLNEGRLAGSSYSFDEAFYLENNADVAAAVAAGAYASGRAHFDAAGEAEGRNPNPLFNDTFYRTYNPDVAEAVAAGDFSSAYAHFEAAGGREGRAPSLYFDAARYLEENPDVADAGMNPLDHYLTHGLYEGRSAYTISADTPASTSAAITSVTGHAATVSYDQVDYFGL
tara:strand:- start:218 stop:1912 length:1695 start_codon:yes stop_codon:yes gene_type:complete